MPTLYARLIAYALGVAACIGVGWYLGGLAPKAALASLQAQDWQAKAQATQVALMAVQGQLKQAQAVSANNSKTIQDLNDENVKISADRDSELALARRLLNLAKASPSSGAQLPQAGSGQGTTDTGQTPGPTRLENLLADAAAESQRCAAQLNSLIAEITPQL